MSDLLSRLIERASGTPSPVEPVLGSRYEPQAPFVAASMPVEEPPNREAKKPETEQVVLPQQRLESIRMVAAEPQPAPEPPPHEPVSRPPRAVQAAAAPFESQTAREHVVRVLPGVSHIESSEIRIEATARSTTESAAESRIVERKPPAVPAPLQSEGRSQRIGVEALRSPDIEISIGHIELRMAAPARPAVQPQARPRPEASDERFLRGCGCDGRSQVAAEQRHRVGKPERCLSLCGNSERAFA
jgi:hypothetical protein